jgi:hypothetical protein
MRNLGGDTLEARCVSTLIKGIAITYDMHSSLELFDVAIAGAENFEGITTSNAQLMNDGFYYIQFKLKKYLQSIMKVKLIKVVSYGDTLGYTAIGQFAESSDGDVIYNENWYALSDGGIGDYIKMLIV